MESRLDVPTWRPRLRDSVIVQRDGDELLFICTGDRTVKRFSADERAMRLLPLLTGRKTVAELAEAVGAASVEEIRPVLQVLEEERLLSKASDFDGDFLTLGSRRAYYYDRQLRLFQDFCDEELLADLSGVDVQRRLDGATVVICGVGGLGGWIAHLLGLAGVGTLRLCDFDRVELTDLARQPLFTVEDVGRSKVGAAAARIGDLNPHVTVEQFMRKMSGPDDLGDLVAGADLVIAAADEPSPVDVATWISEACREGIPHIIGGGYAYHLGVVGTTVIPGRSACWECVRSVTLAEHGRAQAITLIPRRQRTGGLGVLNGLVASVLAWEAIRVVVGLPPALTDRWLEIDLWSLTKRVRSIERRPDCPACGDAGA